MDSLIVFTEFGDRLTFEPAANDALIVTGEFSTALDNGEIATPQFNRQTQDNRGANNLVMRALDGYRQAGGVIDGLAITLEKTFLLGRGLAADRPMQRHYCGQ